LDGKPKPVCNRSCGAKNKQGLALRSFSEAGEESPNTLPASRKATQDKKVEGNSLQL